MLCYYALKKKLFQKFYLQVQGYVKLNEESEKNRRKCYDYSHTTIWVATKHYSVPDCNFNFVAMVSKTGSNGCFLL
jgi:hypothetical protein